MAFISNTLNIIAIVPQKDNNEKYKKMRKRFRTIGICKGQKLCNLRRKWYGKYYRSNYFGNCSCSVLYF